MKNYPSKRFHLPQIVVTFHVFHLDFFQKYIHGALCPTIGFPVPRKNLHLYPSYSEGLWPDLQRRLGPGKNVKKGSKGIVQCGYFPYFHTKNASNVIR